MDLKDVLKMSFITSFEVRSDGFRHTIMTPLPCTGLLFSVFERSSRPMEEGEAKAVAVRCIRYLNDARTIVFGVDMGSVPLEFLHDSITA